MKIVKILAMLGAIAMTIALLNGFINGDFFEDGGELLNNPWGIVSLVDLYVGFVLFSIWIVYRESSLISQIVWVVLMMVLGFFTASIYLLHAAYTADNNVLTLLHGHRANQFRVKE